MSEDNYLCMKGWKYGMENKKQEEVLLKVGMGGFELHEFINWANNFSEKEILEAKQSNWPTEGH